MGPLKSRLLRFAPIVLVLGFGIFLFVGTLHNPFTSDDVHVALLSPQIYDTSLFPEIFWMDLDRPIPDGIAIPEGTTSRTGLYRPFLLLTYSMNGYLSGEDPFSWRLTNLLLHLIASLLVLGVATHILGSRLGGLTAALLFVSHPVHTAAVATLMGGRSELMAFIFVLASWWLFLFGENRSGKTRWALDIGSAFLFLCGLWSKENAIVVPGILFWCGWTLRNQPTKTLLVRLIPHLVVFVLYTFIRIVIIGRLEAVGYSHVFAGASAGKIVLYIMVILANYLRLTLVPYPLQVQTCHENTVFSTSDLVGVLCGVLVLGLIGIAAWRSIKGRSSARPSFWAFCLLFFFFCLGPVSHVIPHWVVMAERLVYLPSLALCLLGGWLAVRAASYRWWLPIAVGLPLLSAYSAGTLSRNADWADLDRLWTKTAECAPDEFGPYNLMGTARLREGRTEEALPFFRKAIEIAPTRTEPYYNLGVALQRLGRLQEAEQAYRKSLECQPGFPMALLNLGTLLEAKGDLTGAMRHYQKAAKLEPTHPAAFINMGNLHQREGRYQESEKLFKMALSIAPRHTEAMFNLARLYTRTERKEAAERLYRKILDIRPNHAMATNNLANFFKDRNQLDQAEILYRKALRFDPDCGPAHYNLASLLLSIGNPARAAHHFIRALVQKPKNLDALIGLGHARLSLGQHALAQEAAHNAQQLAPENPRVLKLLEIIREESR